MWTKCFQLTLASGHLRKAPMGGTRYLRLTAASILFWHGLHWALRKHFVRRAFDPVFRKYCGREAEGRQGGAVRNGGGKTAEVLSESQVAELTDKCLNLVFSVIASGLSMAIMWETKSDVVYSRSRMLVPAVDAISWYFVVDLLALWETFSLSSTVTKQPPLQFGRMLTLFVRKKWPIVLHHMVLLFIAWPLAEARSNLGDFMVGAFLAHEFSTPFLAIAKILKMFNLHGSTVALANGAFLLLLFFLCRVVKWPLMILLAATQHHHLSLGETAASMSPVCFLTVLLDIALELYWLSALAVVATRTLQDRKKQL